MTARRARAWAVGGALLCVAVLAGCEGAAQTSTFNLVNTRRAQRSIAAFHDDPELMTKAQHWADYVAARDSTQGSVLTSGVTGCYKALAENIGVGTSVEQVIGAEIADVGVVPPIDRNHLLSTELNALGVGVSERNGKFYVVLDFKLTC